MSLSKEIENAIQSLLGHSNILGAAIRDDDEPMEKRACLALKDDWVVLHALLKSVDALEGGFKYDEAKE